MKKLILLGLVLTLALGIGLASSVAAVGPYPIPITKTIPPGGPIEDFTFEAWRDFNNNNVIDAGDVLVGTVVITGAGTGVINSPFMGNTIVHEVLAAGSAYEQLPDRIVHPPCGEVIFENIRKQQDGQLEIRKVDGSGNALAGACFTITPDPRTGADFLELCDNDANDEDPRDGYFLLTECIIDLVCTVEETTVPPGYEGADPQTVTISATLTVTFVNTEIKCELIIRKLDESRNLLAGACFTITPDPRTGTDSLELCDNDANDESPLEGILSLSGLICGLEVTVEETTVPDGYVGADPRTITIGETAEMNFVNERCGLVIHKVDAAGNFLAGATFVITPNPKTGTGSLTVVDNGLNDECPEDGVLCLSGLICGLTCTVEETVAPTGYQKAPSQTVAIEDTPVLTFVNRRTPSCGTVCAAQTGPGVYLFGGTQSNWFTYITYDKGWGTEASPKTYPIYTGKDKLCGTLYVYDKLVSAGVTHLFVKYVLTDTGTCTLAGISQYHLQVDRTLTNLKRAIVNKSGNPVPGKCEYIGTLDPMQPATGWIEATNDNIFSWSNPIYIFAHGIGCYYCP